MRLKSISEKQEEMFLEILEVFSRAKMSSDTAKGTVSPKPCLPHRQFTPKVHSEKIWL